MLEAINDASYERTSLKVCTRTPPVRSNRKVLPIPAEVLQSKVLSDNQRVISAEVVPPRPAGEIFSRSRSRPNNVAYSPPSLKLDD